MDICRIFAEAGAEYKDDRHTERPETEDKQAVLTLSVDISINRLIESDDISVGRSLGWMNARSNARSKLREITGKDRATRAPSINLSIGESLQMLRNQSNLCFSSEESDRAVDMHISGR